MKGREEAQTKGASTLFIRPLSPLSTLSLLVYPYSPTFTYTLSGKRMLLGGVWVIDGRTDGWSAGRGRGLELDCQQLLQAETLYRVVQLNLTPEIECRREYINNALFSSLLRRPGFR